MTLVVAEWFRTFRSRNQRRRCGRKRNHPVVNLRCPGARRSASRRTAPQWSGVEEIMVKKQGRNVWQWVLVAAMILGVTGLSSGIQPLPPGSRHTP